MGAEASWEPPPFLPMSDTISKTLREESAKMKLLGQCGLKGEVPSHRLRDLSNIFKMAADGVDLADTFERQRYWPSRWCAFWFGFGIAIILERLL